MKRRSIRAFLLFLALGAPAATVFAGGAWIPEPGDGSFNLGYSKKHAASSWDAFGERFDNSSQHDFRYTYLDGDVGLFPNLSAQFLLTSSTVAKALPATSNGTSDFPTPGSASSTRSTAANTRWRSERPYAAGLIVPIPLGPRHRWNVEVGYNKWIWGRSARTYQEPYFSIGYGF